MRTKYFWYFETLLRRSATISLFETCASIPSRCVRCCIKTRKPCTGFDRFERFSRLRTSLSLTIRLTRMIPVRAHTLCYYGLVDFRLSSLCFVLSYGTVFYRFYIVISYSLPGRKCKQCRLWYIMRPEARCSERIRGYRGELRPVWRCALGVRGSLIKSDWTASFEQTLKIFARLKQQR